jgi:hypothetical protein
MRYDIRASSSPTCGSRHGKLPLRLLSVRRAELRGTSLLISRSRRVYRRMQMSAAGRAMPTGGACTQRRLREPGASSAVGASSFDDLFPPSGIWKGFLEIGR